MSFGGILGGPPIGWCVWVGQVVWSVRCWHSHKLNASSPGIIRRHSGRTVNSLVCVNDTSRVVCVMLAQPQAMCFVSGYQSVASRTDRPLAGVDWRHKSNGLCAADTALPLCLFVCLSHRLSLVLLLFSSVSRPLSALSFFPF